MSSFDVGTAFVRVIPDTRGFQALLQAQVTAAVNAVTATVAVNPVLAGAGSATGTSATASVAAASAVRNLKDIDVASRQASKGLLSASQESKVLQGSIVGLSRITPVAVFGLGVAGSAALATGLAIKASITSFADFEQQLNTFQAVTKATAAEMESIRSLSIELGADISLPATSAGDAAVALTELAKAGLSVQDSLAAARGVLQLASAAGIDAGSAAQIAATQLNAFQLAGSDATRVAELLADASVSAQGEITDFAAAFGQASAVANQVGLSIEDTTGLLTQLGQAGLQGADGGTSLRTALLRLVPTTKEAREYVKALGIEIDDTKSVGEQIIPIIEQYRTQLEKLTPVQQQEALTQIFGQDAIRAASILFTQQEGALKDLTDEFARNNSIQDLSTAKAEGLKGALGSLQSTFETLGIQLGGFVAGPLEGLIRGLNDSIVKTQNLLEFLDQVTFSDQIEKTITVIFEADAGPFGSVGKALGILGLGPAGAPILSTKLFLDLFGEDAEPVTPAIPLGPFRGEIGGNRPDESTTAAAKAAAAEASKLDPALQKALDDLKNAQEKTNLEITVPRSLQQDLVDAQINDSLQQELKADNAIVAFFQERLANLKKGTDKYLAVSGQLAQAQAERDAVVGQIEGQQAANAAEQKRIADEAVRAAKEQAAAQAQLRETILSIDQQRLQNRLSFALSTPETDDEKRVYELQIARFQRLKAQAEKIRDAAKNGSQEQKDAQLEIEKLNGQIIGTRILIKNLGKDKNAADGGFSLQELFQSAVDQFNTFGSNIAGRNGVLSGQDARGSLGAAIINGRDKNLSIQGQQLSTQEKMLAVLASIDTKVGGRTGGSPPVAGKGKEGNLLDIYGTQIAAAYGYGAN